MFLVLFLSILVINQLDCCIFLTFNQKTSVCIKDIQVWFRKHSWKQKQTALLAVELMKMFSCRALPSITTKPVLKAQLFPVHSSAKKQPKQKYRQIPTTVLASGAGERWALPASPSAPTWVSLLSPAPEICRNLIISQTTTPLCFTWN